MSDHFLNIMKNKIIFKNVGDCKLNGVKRFIIIQKPQLNKMQKLNRQ